MPNMVKKYFNAIGIVHAKEKIAIIVFILIVKLCAIKIILAV